jgi:hypothetical protein
MRSDKTIVALAAAALIFAGGVLAAPAPAAPANAKHAMLVLLPKGDELVFPIEWGLSVEMIYSPKKKPVERPDRMIFLVDKAGAPWIGNAGKTLGSLTTPDAVTPDKPYRDAIFLDGGALLAVDENDLGMYKPGTEEERAQRPYLMHFQPRMALPFKDMRLFPGEGDTLFVVGRNPKTGRDEVFRTVDQPDGTKKFTKLVGLKEPVSSVAGDANATYIAAGPAILKIGAERKNLEIIVKLTENVRDLAYSSKSGLFYASAKGVGYLTAKTPLRFLTAPDAEIRLQNESLFVFLRGSQQVIKFGGLGGFSKFAGRRD